VFGNARRGVRFASGNTNLKAGRKTCGRCCGPPSRSTGSNRRFPISLLIGPRLICQKKSIYF
jgi:hypothetical protein